MLTQGARGRGMYELNGLWADCVWFKMPTAVAITVALGRRKAIVSALVVGMAGIVLWNVVMLWLHR